MSQPRPQLLYKTTSSGCKIVHRISSEGVAVTQSIPNWPIMFWPDDTVCWPVTMYLEDITTSYIKRAKTNSPRARRGTPIIKAGNLSPLIRYCYKANKGFAELTDDDIYNLIDFLRKEPHPHKQHHLRRKDTQTNQIVRLCLNFLAWYQNYSMPEPTLIGEDANLPITIEYNEVSGKSTKGTKFKRTFIDHRYLPTKSTPETVHPIGHHSITKLYDANRDASYSTPKKKRDEVILKMLEAAFGRRIETANLTVSDINTAMKTGKLVLFNAKRTDDSERGIPIAKEWLDQVDTYIRTHRKKLIKTLKEKSELKGDTFVDNGYLFLNTRNGEKISEDTITKMISNLANLAGIDEKTCAHMFRHRGITIVVATYLKGYTEHNLPTEMAHTILTKVSVLSGHSDPMSLTPYIDLAFAELGIWDTADKVLALRSTLEANYRALQTLRNRCIMKEISQQEAMVEQITLMDNMLNSTHESEGFINE
jgi:integrase